MKPTAAIPEAARTKTGQELTMVEMMDSPNEGAGFWSARGEGWSPPVMRSVSSLGVGASGFCGTGSE